MKKHHWLDFAEYASVIGLGVGSLASIVYTQMLFVSAPLSLLVLLNLANRRRLEHDSEQKTSLAVNAIDQRLTEQIDQLSQQVMALPTVEVVGGLKKSMLLKNREVVEKLSGEIVAIQRELQERLKLIEKQDLAVTRQDINQLSEKCARHAESLAEINSHLNRLSSAARVDGLEHVIDKLRVDVSQLQGNLQEITSYTKPNLASLQDQMTHLNRQLQKIPPPIDQTALKQEISELVRMVADLVPKREFSALTAQIQELNRQQEGLKQSIATQIQSINQQQDSLTQQQAGLKQSVASLETVTAKLPETELTQFLEEQLDRLLSTSDLSNRYPEVQGAIAQSLGQVQEQLVSLQKSTQLLAEQQQQLHHQVSQLPQTLDAVSIQNQIQEIANRITGLESNAQSFQTQIETNLNQELQQVNQKLRSLPTTPQYEFIFDFSTDTGERTSGSRAALEQALTQTKERLILICPWSSENRLDGELLQKLQQYLRQNRRLDLGWCFQASREENRLLNKIVRGWEVVAQQRNDLQTTLRELLKLKQAFPDRFQFKVLGTAENFLVSDQNLAIVGIPDTLSTHSVFTQLQLKLRTTDPKVIKRLIHQFDEPALEPTDLLAHWNRAVTCHELGDRQGAVNDFTHILSLNPEDAIAYNYRGIVRSELNDTPGALADFTQALQLNPRLIAACYNRGFLHLEMGNQLAAIADFSLAIQLQPDAAIAYFYRGLASQKLGDLQGAIKDYSTAIQLSPNAAVAYYYRGVSYQKLENLSDAIADLETAARLFNTLGSKNNVQKALNILTKLRSASNQKSGLSTAAVHQSTKDNGKHSTASESMNGDCDEAPPEPSADQIQVVDVEVLSPELVIDPVAAMHPAQPKRKQAVSAVLVSDNGLLYTARSGN